jgi:hypothetical protein
MEDTADPGYLENRFGHQSKEEKLRVRREYRKLLDQVEGTCLSPHCDRTSVLRKANGSPRT